MAFAASGERGPTESGALQLRRWRPSGAARVRLVCLPWCGAGANVYRRFAALLPDSVDLLAVQLPGREERYREPLLRRMDSVIEHVAAALVARRDLPLVLFGHSMGAVVAHELAHALRIRSGGEPALLILSGHAAPGCTEHHAEHHAERWHSSSDAEMLHNLRRIGGTPDSLLGDAALMQAMLPVLRADYEVLETHVPAQHPALHCPLVACTGTDDSSAPPASLSSWLSLTRGAGETHAFEGGHFHLLQRPDRFACQMLAWLDRHVGLESRRGAA